MKAGVTFNEAAPAHARPLPVQVEESAFIERGLREEAYLGAGAKLQARLR